MRAAARAAAAGLLRTVVPASRRHAPDRRLLEAVLLPALDAAPHVERLLFVGCARYTAHYPALAPNVEFWTLEPDRRRARYGAPRHIVAPLQDLDALSTTPYDAMVVNGVLGWGLDHRTDAEDAFAACHSALRPGGLLVLGWNDVAPRNRILPGTLDALAAFAPTAFAGLPPRLRLPGAEHHVFDFYRR